MKRRSNIADLHIYTLEIFQKAWYYESNNDFLTQKNKQLDIVSWTTARSFFLSD